MARIEPGLPHWLSHLPYGHYGIAYDFDTAALVEDPPMGWGARHPCLVFSCHPCHATIWPSLCPKVDVLWRWLTLAILPTTPPLERTRASLVLCHDHFSSADVLRPSGQHVPLMSSSWAAPKATNSLVRSLPILTRPT
ncbi:hypothetical protein DACRYDRAFT_21941 [Dacryopinax primogenitus]|uniref:Uncharacterized protein n=1 Tax=Dacryopinax primogenitus (strain DJM 731) TaxID=1858805 RepID=M5G8P9_DACPD|nr:uncharacterized protein DACRYDRAFT_21941 [Dacryopinax primogenitus]EJU02217.1 hypothetical protein DACRYDRAFT_21941 [Dacryopinax primogenitus]